MRFIPLHLPVSEGRKQRILHILLGTALFFNACQAKPSLEEQFVEKDTTPPQVLSITPSHGATEVVDRPTITIAFNEPMDAGTLNSSTVTVRTQAGTAAIGSYEYDTASNALVIRIVQNLFLNTTYIITVTDQVKDRAGNSFTGMTSNFSTDVCPKAKAGNVAFNGSISSMTKIGCAIYLAGSFTRAGFVEPYGTVVDSVSGAPAAGFKYPEINGHVTAVISDDNGGWYIGGYFTKVGDKERNRLAHISASGEVLAWNPSIDDDPIEVGAGVHTLIKNGSTIIVGGWFPGVNGVPRKSLAAIDISGALKPWNPSVQWGDDENGAVDTMMIRNLILYFGGGFTEVNGQSRSRLAAIRIDDACLSNYNSSCLEPWAPGGNGSIQTIVSSESAIYIGGFFTSINDTARNKLAALDFEGNLLDWNPSPNGNIYSLQVDGATIYVGGSFSQISGNTRSNMAALDTDGNLLPFYPVLLGSVSSIAIDDSIVYIAGSFHTINSESRGNVAAFDANGNLLSLNPDTDTEVYSLAIHGTQLFIAGRFTTLGRIPRNYLAAVNTAGKLLDWNPGAGSPVYLITSDGTTIFLGGQFSNIGGSTRNRVAAVDIDGNLLSWNPSASPLMASSVNSLAVHGSMLFIGGNFTTMGGVTRNRLAAVDISQDCLNNYNVSCLKPWNPSVNSGVFSLAVNGSTLFAGGAFTSINSTGRNRLAALDISDECLSSYAVADCLLPWNPDANVSVSVLTRVGSNLYAAGGFSTIGGIPRNRLAAWNAAGDLLPWNPGADQTVRSISVGDSSFVIGGDFTVLDGVSRRRLARFDLEGNLDSWSPQANETVHDILMSGSVIYATGTFTEISEQTSFGFASINTDGSVNW